MSIKVQERLAVFATVTLLLSLTVGVFLNAPWRSSGARRTVHLTGVNSSGVWTDQEVNGLNYWWKSFQPATIIMEEGEEILLRLSSPDVTHSFYVPELNPEPVMVEPGHTLDLLLTAGQAGEYTYYCTTVCGECHYFMTGIIKVVSSLADYVSSDGSEVMAKNCPMHEPPLIFQSLVEHGRFTYNTKGCVACHGENGIGGIYNPNYVKEYVPRLDLIAERMGIDWEEDAEIIINLIEKGTDLSQLEEDPPIDNFSRFLAQYQSIKDKIHLGAPKIQKQDPNGPEPPLTMPSWQEELSKNDIDAVIAYLLTQYPWDEDD